MPKSRDASEGFYRRWIVIPFDNVFKESPEIARGLAAALSNPAELSGLLNRALDAWPNVAMRGISTPPSVEEAIREFRSDTDPLARWLDEQTEEAPDLFIVQAEFIKAYRDHCIRSKISHGTKKAFGQKLKRYKPKVSTAQRMMDGNRVGVYVGIRLREASDAVVSVDL